jgi:thiol-disulfide isomerase/thioredoxin
MSLTIREQSEQVKAAAAERLPAHVVEVFDQSIQQLLDEGLPSDVVQVGDTLEPFTLSDATGSLISLDEILQSGPAVIVFYRGGWCPYCNVALRTYQRELVPELPQFGARLVAISPQAPDLRPSRRRSSTSPFFLTLVVVLRAVSELRFNKRMTCLRFNANWVSTSPR